MSKSTFNSIASWSEWSESLVKHLLKTHCSHRLKCFCLKSRPPPSYSSSLFSSLLSPNANICTFAPFSNVFKRHGSCVRPLVQIHQSLAVYYQRANDIYWTVGVSPGGAWFCKMERWKTQSWHDLMDVQAKQVRLRFTSRYVTVK